MTRIVKCFVWNAKNVQFICDSVELVCKWHLLITFPLITTPDATIFIALDLWCSFVWCWCWCCLCSTSFVCRHRPTHNAMQWYRIRYTCSFDGFLHIESREEERDTERVKEKARQNWTKRVCVMGEQMQRAKNAFEVKRIFRRPKWTFLRMERRDDRKNGKCSCKWRFGHLMGTFGFIKIIASKKIEIDTKNIPQLDKLPNCKHQSRMVVRTGGVVDRRTKRERERKRKGTAKRE